MLCLLAVCALGSHRGAAAADCLAPDQLKAETIDRAFIQWRYLTGMSQPLRTEGRLRVTADQISWHMTKPFDVETLVSAEGLFQSVNGGPPQPIAGDGAGFSLAIVRSLADLLRGQWDSLRGLFEITQASTPVGAPWSLTLVPSDAALSGLFASIEIDGCNDVSAVEIAHQGGDRTVIEFAGDAAQ